MSIRSAAVKSAAVQAVEDADETAVGTDQPASDANRSRFDADRAALERDQAQTEADRRASQRDLAAADRDRSLHASTDAKFQEALAAIQAARERNRAEREAAAADRAHAGDDRARAAEDRGVAAIDRSRAALDREQAKGELEKAQHDDLTGFFRLGLGTVVLQREIDRSRRSSGRMVLAYCDVDGLKQVNDEQGHAAGDALLKGLAEAIRSRLRSYDPVVRIGGDEFVCGLSETDLEQAGRIFRHIQDDFATQKSGASVSYGLAALRPQDSLATLLERSDRALRAARSAQP